MERTTWFFLVQYCCCMAASLIMAAQTNISTDQSALLALKDRITTDPQNMILTNWSTTSPVCNWVGVTCGARHHRVTFLNISYFGLEGTIPPELGNLSFLVELLVKNNSFHGPLPQEMARLQRLKFISFRFNNFKGIIPSWFGSLSKLQAFDLYGNQFSGYIPAAIFNLSALKVINLSYNQLSGSIPKEIGNLTMLKEIKLDGNNFKELPNEIGTLDQLEELYVQFNALQGPIPMALFNMSSLIILTFFRNNLTGSLPDNICQHLPNIQELSLTCNQFEGPLPSKWLPCTQLLSLQLEMNSFSGSIYTHRYCKLNPNKDDCPYSTIPHEIGYLPNLEALSLGTNNLNGVIPSSIFNISTITQLDLTANELSGSLPTKIGLQLPNLLELYLGGNKLSGVIPKCISNASQLTIIDLGDNFLSGFIPNTLCALTKLEVLSLFQNNLTLDTSIPEAADILSYLPNLKKLVEFQILNNPLNAKLPISFWNFSTSLHIVKLGNCNLRGNIPNEIGHLSSLTLLDLGENELSGPVPTSMVRLKNLQILDLSGNKLQGHIPDELCQLNHLGELYLDGNQLSGSIPSCLGNLTATLRSLSLGYNMLNFTIPSTLWTLTNILKLDLSSNSLIGPVSEGVGNLKVATLIELSNNQLSGSIPNSIGSLQNLVSLSLANNNLQGLIPSSVGKSISLEHLDLPTNNLSGVIPKSLESLSYLKYLNLSFNKLKGEIPTGGPFKNLSAQSFVSNHGLCGILSPMLLVTILFWMVMLCRKKDVEAPTETTVLAQLEWKRVSYNELVGATNGFNLRNLLGRGGFGSVYRGRLSDGIDVAIKVFNSEAERGFTSFEVECKMLSNIRHRNLVKVISCCSEIDFKALVLNYMPNGSLEKWLYSQNCSLNMLQRLDIMIDVASALEYLHHGYDIPIVHCDLKPSDILLDDDMGAHVSDFGIAKFLDGGDSMTQTMTLATIGYMAPEYGMEGMVNRRGDVYSFGIIVMEIFTRRKPTDEMFVGEMSLKQWVANSLFADAIVEVVDTSLLGIEDDHDIVRKECLSSLMRLALSCSAESSEERVTMQEALARLEKIKNKFLKDTAGNVALNRPLIHKSFNDPL
ncbi:putative LRR receptor-like serine/threonine-protein kinase [Rosa sericea]